MGLFDGNPGSSTTSAPAWLQQPMQQYLSQVAQITSRPYSQYMGPQIAPLTGLQQQAYGGMGGVMGGSPAMAAGEGWLSSLFGPQQSSPGLDAVLNRTRQGVTDAYRSATGATTRRFNEPGQWGGSSHMMEQTRNDEALARGLGDALGQIEYGDFNNAMNRRMSAVPLAGQMAQQRMGLLESGLRAGTQQQGYGQALADAMRSDWTQARDWDWTQADRFRQAMGGVMGGAGQTTTTTAPSNPLSQLMGLGILGYGSGMFGSLFGPGGG